MTHHPFFISYILLPAYLLITHPFMLARKFRLPSSHIHSFKGSRYTCSYFILLSKSSTLSHDRLAVIVSKKVSHQAVRRHQLKRQLISAFTPYLTLPPHYDHLLIVRSHATTTSFSSLTQPLLSAMSSLYKPPLSSPPSAASL